jgi:GNAT superfamily N-acetyltransferase
MRQDGLSAVTPGVAHLPDGLRDAQTPADFDAARNLFREYVTSLGVDLGFQDFEGELAALPGDYAPPSGRLLIAGPPGASFGCAALRRLDSRTGEIKRMYVQPAHRSEGWGRRLAEAIIDAARTVGYRELKLDTLKRLLAARALYAELGFVECDPYYVNPIADVVYMTLRLDGRAA